MAPHDRHAEGLGHGLEAQAGLYVRAYATHCPGIALGDIDGGIGQVEAETRTQLAIEHGNIERHAPPDQRPVTDEIQKLRESILDARAAFQVDAAQAVDADRVTGQAGRTRQSQIQRLAGQHPVAAYLDRGDRDQLVATRIEAGGLAVDGHHLVAGIGIEQPTVIATGLATTIGHTAPRF